MPGLYNKYEVWKDGVPAEGRYFVLKPDSDPAALAALRAYALETPSIELQNDLLRWIWEIEEAAVAQASALRQRQIEAGEYHDDNLTILPKPL